MASDMTPEKLDLIEARHSSGEDDAVAYVGFATGRHYLDVAGFAVAMEGDPCREAKIPARWWDTANLRRVADALREIVVGREKRLVAALWAAWGERDAAVARADAAERGMARCEEQFDQARARWNLERIEWGTERERILDPIVRAKMLEPPPAFVLDSCASAALLGAAVARADAAELRRVEAVAEAVEARQAAREAERKALDAVARAEKAEAELARLRAALLP